MLSKALRYGVLALRSRLEGLFYTWDSVSVAFIISTGRTGTRFLARLFSEACDGVDARHEPAPDLFRLGTGYVRSEFSFKQAVSRLRGSRQHICTQVHRNGLSTYIEANNNLAYLIPVVRTVFPDCRIVHLVRDGRTFVRSSYSKRVPTAGMDGTRPLVMTDQDPRRRLQATDFPDGPYYDRWPEMSRFERVCWYWAKKDGIIRDALQGDSASITVRFEDIFDAGRGFPGVWQIADFLGLTEKLRAASPTVEQRMAAKENPTEAFLLPPWDDWSPEQKDQFTRIAGPHMEAQGYSV